MRGRIFPSLGEVNIEDFLTEIVPDIEESISRNSRLSYHKPYDTKKIPSVVFHL